jgi:hypothetical protein
MGVSVMNVRKMGMLVRDRCVTMKVRMRFAIIPIEIHAHADDVHHDYACVHVQAAHAHDHVHAFPLDDTKHLRTSAHWQPKKMGRWIHPSITLKQRQ